MKFLLCKTALIVSRDSEYCVIRCVTWFMLIITAVEMIPYCKSMLGVLSVSVSQNYWVLVMCTMLVALYWYVIVRCTLLTSVILVGMSNPEKVQCSTC